VETFAFDSTTNRTGEATVQENDKTLKLPARTGCPRG
jgi:hypothetical protein